MCGIFAYIGQREAAPILLRGLERLEYRGYDSAGISIKEDSVKTLKVEGRINGLRKKVERENLNGTIGIAHTRWATHGKPITKNAHPHQCCKDEITLVHNGIIENYQKLKIILSKENHYFKSDTDTEVIVHLIEKFYKGNLEEAIKKALPLIKGTYGFAVMSEKEDKIVAARKGSPLVLGIGEKEYFLASDPSAIIEHTKRVLYMEDGDLLSITKDGYTIKSLNGDARKRPVETMNWNIEELEKKGYSHFMLKEIYEQPDAITNTLRGRIKKDKTNAHLGGLNLSDEEIIGVKKIIMIACGTSWHACLVGEYLFEHYLGLPVEVEYASEFRYRKPILNKGDLVIAVSQSGETADTLAALEEAKKLGATTMGIVNVVGSAVARKANGGIYLHAGPEIGVASTKAFTCQIIAMHLLNIYFGRIKGTINSKTAKNLIKSMETIPDKIKEALKLDKEIKKIADTYYEKKNCLYLGRGINFPVALEGALKLKEISYIHAEGYPAAEMKHGPIALIDEDMPVVFIANKKNTTYEKILSNMEEVKARKGKIIAIATEKDSKIKELTEQVISVPEINESLTPIINTIPLQLLAYHMAVNKGIDVDKPRNLAKSVTVE
ncbi:glutamine--fructose-6-phosphate transaminase (isomerizing) [Bacteroidota bacterium]